MIFYLKKFHNVEEAIKAQANRKAPPGIFYYSFNM